MKYPLLFTICFYFPSIYPMEYTRNITSEEITKAALIIGGTTAIYSASHLITENIDYFLSPEHYFIKECPGSVDSHFNQLMSNDYLQNYLWDFKAFRDKSIIQQSTIISAYGALKGLRLGLLLSGVACIVKMNNKDLSAKQLFLLASTSFAVNLLIKIGATAAILIQSPATINNSRQTTINNIQAYENINTSMEESIGCNKGGPNNVTPWQLNFNHSYVNKRYLIAKKISCSILTIAPHAIFLQGLIGIVLYNQCKMGRKYTP